MMSINLMKRMESSVYSFRLTLKRINDLITDTIKSIADFEYGYNKSSLNLNDITNMDLDGDDQNDDVFAIGKKVTLQIWIISRGDESLKEIRKYWICFLR